MSKKRLKTRPEWEDALRNGQKTIDARWVSDEVGGLEVGHRVCYPGAKAVVKGIRFYRGFRDLLAHEPWQQIAPAASGPSEVLKLLEGTPASAARHTGVVAIELEPTDD